MSRLQEWVEVVTAATAFRAPMNQMSRDYLPDRTSLLWRLATPHWACGSALGDPPPAPSSEKVVFPKLVQVLSTPQAVDDRCGDAAPLTAGR